ncbi:MAG TPA: ethanolamine ammonia-lyase subunit EutC [Spirosoma sp.]|jgi:ethanolamine ammonia-lyase small subunit|nr:ethanolamine ammonia-lyase subunit EutC [Spirosoma sp.]
MNELRRSPVETDEWQTLKAFTDARIALGKTGVSVPIKESLALKLAHAHAKDAVYSSLDKGSLLASLKAAGLPVYCLQSRAANRDIYLQRPDLGRRLADDSAGVLGQLDPAPADLSIILADGLSAIALNENAWPVVQLLIDTARKKKYSIAPLTLVEQGRVAIADEIGSLLQARLTVILIGERPGLSSFDSMGAYMTYAPHPGLTDERRNCVSNIRRQGLSAAMAAEKIMYLIHEAFRLELTGVALKDNNIAGLNKYL